MEVTTPMATENSIQDSELEARYDKYKGIPIEKYLEEMTNF